MMGGTAEPAYERGRKTSFHPDCERYRGGACGASFGPVAQRARSRNQAAPFVTNPAGRQPRSGLTVGPEPRSIAPGGRYRAAPPACPDPLLATYVGHLGSL